MAICYSVKGFVKMLVRYCVSFFMSTVKVVKRTGGRTLHLDQIWHRTMHRDQTWHPDLTCFWGLW